MGSFLSDNYNNVALVITLIGASQQKTMIIQGHTMRVSNTVAAFAHYRRLFYEKEVDLL